MRLPALSLLLLLTAMASIQVGAAFAKTLFPRVGAEVATLFRIWIAALILLVVYQPWRKRVSRQAQMAIALYGVALGGMNLLFYMALERIPLGITVALEFTGPLAVALLASRKPFDFIWAVLAAAGIVMVLPLSEASARLDWVGIIYALGAGFCWAFYILFGKRAGGATQGGQATAIGMLIAAWVVLPAGIGNLGPGMFAPDILLMAGAVAVLSSALPYSLEMHALRKIPAKTFGIFMSVEPALATLAGLIFLGERLSLLQWTAIACIIAASAGSAATGHSDAHA